MEEMIQEKVVQKENELNATYDERLRNYEERSVSVPFHYIFTLLTFMQGTRPPPPNIPNQESTTRSTHVE